MKTLSREEIQRMVGRSNSRRNVAGNNQESSSQGFATPSWVDENYLSKSFFSTLFIIHATQTVTVTDDQGQPVGEPTVTEITLTPNLLPGTTSVTDSTTGYTTTTVIAITSIEATKDFYSDGGVSALGQSSGGGGGGASALTDLVDVAISSPTNGQVLMYNSSTGKWYNGNVQSGGGGTVTSITAGTGLTGGTITTSGTIALSEDTRTAIAAGVTAYGWGDHSQAGYLTSSSLNGYATQQWVQQQGYLTSHQSVGGTFWGQSWSNHGNVSGDMTDVGIIFQTGSYTLMNHQGIGLMIEGSAVTGSEYRATFGFHQEGALAWLNNNYVMQLKANTSTGEYLVHINNGILQIGDARLVWDSANNALKVVKEDGTAANLYATGGVSALGMSAGVSQVDAMTFNYVTINNNLEFGAASRITHAVTNDDRTLYIGNSDNSGWVALQDVCSQRGESYWKIMANGEALFAEKVQSPKFYLDSTRYLYINGGTLYYYNGSTSRQIAFA